MHFCNNSQCITFVFREIKNLIVVDEKNHERGLPQMV